MPPEAGESMPKKFWFYDPNDGVVHGPTDEATVKGYLAEFHAENREDAWGYEAPLVWMGTPVEWDAEVSVTLHARGG